MKFRVVWAVLLLVFCLSSCNNTPTDNSSVSSENSSSQASSSETQSESEPPSSNKESSSEEESDSAPPVISEDLSKYPGYKALSGNSKDAYSAITKALLDCSDSVNISRYRLSRDETKKVVGYVINDRPDIFWVDKEYSLIASSDYIQAVSFRYTLSKDQISEKKRLVEASLSSYVSSLSGKSDYEKVKGAHDLIIGKVSYSSNSDAHNICGVFINKAAVCEGYAKAFQLIMQRLGVSCYIVHGSSGGINHVWNLVSVGGRYYHIDLTMDDPVLLGGGSLTAHTYFLLTDAQIKKNHSISAEYNLPLPAATNEADNYYVRENRYIVSYNTDNIVEIIISDIEAGRGFSEMRFSSEADLNKAKEKLKLTDLKRTVSNKTGKTVSWNIIETNPSGAPVYDLILKLSY